MQQTRETALACYDGFSDEQKNKAFAIFEAMNSDGSGEISRKEYEECFGSSTGISFEELDTDGNGALDFEEFITLFYILMTSPGGTTAPVPLIVTRDQSKHFQPNLLERFSSMQLNPPQSSEVERDLFMEQKPSQSDSIGAGSSHSMGEPDSGSNGYSEAVVKAMEDFNTVLSFGNTISTVAKTASLCTIM